MGDITELKNSLFSYFDNRQTMQMTNTLSMIWNDPSVSLEEKLDVLGELTSRDSEYFMEKIYPYKTISYKDLRSGSVPLYQFLSNTFQGLIDMEKYILNNYCFLEGEEIISIINGVLADKKTVTLGRIYLTNYRIIVSGKQTVRSAQSGMRQGIVETLIRSGVTRHRKAVRKAITQAFRKDLKEWNIGEWGYYFPIYKARNIKRGKNSISYAIDVETEKKPINLKIKITPQKLSGQPKRDFQEQKIEALSQIEDLLSHYQ
ncbi:MAG: hypothetical protein ACFFD1_13585 [Candidatus Thorarchaeota archaeon]